MNGNRSMEEVHYSDTSFPCNVTETFMDFYGGITHEPVNYAHAGPVHAQDDMYWSMNTNSFKFGYSGPENALYYGSYEIDDHLSRLNIAGMACEYHPAANIDEAETMVTQAVGDTDTDSHSETEECILDEHNTDSPQVSWQDNIDPDNMTYEELLDLGEAVGTQSRGLSQEVIDSLPTTKYKLGKIFSRKRSGERCVICQMKYKIGDQQMKLPCKHVYHSECISKWLAINKVCPVCNSEVFGEESSV